MLIYLLAEKNEKYVSQSSTACSYSKFLLSILCFIFYKIFMKPHILYFIIKMMLFSKINRRVLKAVHSEKVSEESDQKTCSELEKYTIILEEL